MIKRAIFGAPEQESTLTVVNEEGSSEIEGEEEKLLVKEDR